MAKLAVCRDCGKEVSKKAKTCPNCGVNKPAAPKQYSLGKLVLLIVVVGFVGNSYMDYQQRVDEAKKVASMSPEEQADYEAEKEAARQAELAADAVRSRRDAERKFEESRRWNAFFYAEKAIKRQLKAPSTAEFSDFRESVSARLKGGSPDEYVVKGHVDAQNGFGAMIRDQYQVVVEFEQGSDDSIRLVSAEVL